MNKLDGDYVPEVGDRLKIALMFFRKLFVEKVTLCQKNVLYLHLFKLTLIET